MTILTKRHSLRTNFSWAFVGNIINAACQWGMLSILAKLGSVEIVGLFALGLAITQPLAAFTDLQLRGVFCTDTKNEYTFGDYLGMRIGGIVITVVFSAIIAFIFYGTWESIVVIVIMSLAVGVKSLGDIYYALFQKYERLDQSSKSMILKGLTSLCSFAVVVLVTKSLYWAITALVVSRFIWIVLFDIPAARKLCAKEYLKPQFILSKMRPLLWLSLPMGINMMILSYSINIPRYYIEAYYGEHALGIFSALAYVIMAGAMITTALSQAALPRLAKQYAEKDLRSFGILMSKLLLVGLTLGAIAMIIAYFMGVSILTILYTSEYAEYHTEFLLVVFSGSLGLLGGFLGVGLTAARVFRSQPVLNLIGCLVSIVSSSYFIPRFGVMGAAISSGIASMVAVVLFSLCLVRCCYVSHNIRVAGFE